MVDWTARVADVEDRDGIRIKIEFYEGTKHYTTRDYDFGSETTTAKIKERVLADLSEYKARKATLAVISTDMVGKTFTATQLSK